MHVENVLSNFLIHWLYTKDFLLFPLFLSNCDKLYRTNFRSKIFNSMADEASTVTKASVIDLPLDQNKVSIKHSFPLKYHCAKIVEAVKN